MLDDDQMQTRVKQADRTIGVPGNDSGDEISLRPYFEILWPYRQIIALAVVGVTALFVLGVLIVFLRVPVERLASLQFRLLFEGAAQNQYPNGTAFSPTEIVAAPVLTEVYQANDLQRFGTYEAFKESMFILGSNPDVDLLTYEYQAKLANTRLTPVDRARTEEEFRRKREALTDPVFSLNMRRHERLTTLPRDLMQKILHDTLTTWAAQADERKGATRYNVLMLSKNILQREVIEREDYLVAVDILRAKTNRVIETIDKLSALPGAQVIRTGEEKISLAEVRTNLEDVVRFKLEPLLDLVRSEGVTKNARGLSLYATNQLFQLRLEREKSQSLVRALQDSLGAYMAQRIGRVPDTTLSGGGGPGAPSGGPAVQLDQSFLDRLMTLSTAEQDQKYRQSLTDRIIQESERMGATQREAAFYEDLVSNIRSVAPRAVGTPETVALIKARTTEAFEEVSKAVDQISALYRELSVRNLNPSTTLYAVTGPFVLSVERSLTVRTVSLYFVLLLMLTLILVPTGCLLHNAFRTRTSVRVLSVATPNS